MKAKKILILMLSAAIMQLICAQAVLQPEILEKLHAAVFEVVVLKPEEGQLEYEKPLPMERIPFAIRTDKYLPIGTAFLMDDGLFYSAAHVFSLYEESLYGDYYLRSHTGQVYKVDSLVSFATDRDFIVFTVEGYTQKGKGLSVKNAISVNTQTFSVGNALGEGIIIREGLLTSQTFEQENGQWKWLRFSAAASPGNSGGPLITPDGDVLGIITMKSANENLNYALPFAETKTLAPNTGKVHLPLYYVVPNILEEKFFNMYDYEQKLPKKLTEVRNDIIADYRTFTAKIIETIQRKFDFDGTESFNTADGSYDIMYTLWLPRFPLIITRTENKTWNTFLPKDLKEHNLAQNGSIIHGQMLNLTFALIEKPDNVTTEQLLSSPKLYMDYLLSASRMYRTVGSERIGINSYGQPARSGTHIDRYGRTWLVNYWTLPFANAETVSFALPLPGGLYIMTKTDSTDAIRNGHNLDLAFITDYVIPRYAGFFKEWQELLSLPEKIYKPDPAIATLKFEFDAKETAFENDTYQLAIPRKQFPTDKESVLRIFLGFTEKDGKVSFGTAGFDMFTNTHNDAYKYIALSKHLNPGEDAPQGMLDKWRQKVNQTAPFNSKPYNQDQYTYYDEILFLKNPLQNGKMPYVYQLSLEVKQQNKFKEIENLAKNVKKALKQPKDYK